jgi:uncharacterized integral membrane protein (TIGR00698 family)
MTEIAEQTGRSLSEPASPSASRRGLLGKEDWWAIWIGLGLVLVAIALFASGASIAWIAIAPRKWTHLAEVGAQLRAHAAQYAALFVLWAVLLGIGAGSLGIRLRQFLPGFLFVYAGALVLYFTGQWAGASRYNLEPPLLALLLGLLISNTVGLPRSADAGFRVEFYVKTGIVLLGAGLPLTLIAWAGPVAIVQAAIVSVVTFAVIFTSARYLGLDRRLAAVLGSGGAICGVSGSIAIAGAVGARRQDVSIGISLVVLWAIVMIFVLPLVSRALGLSTGVAGAWIGTSEFADAAGLAAAQTYGGYAGHITGISGSADAAVNAFTLMKVIGRDIWIGVWAFALSIVATTRWESTGVNTRTRAGEVWRRFPKFVLGFLVASALVTFVTRGYSYAAYQHTVQPNLVAPIQVLRTWAFTFAFLSIGLTTRVRELAAVGARPFYAFSIGVAVNVVLGFILSTQIFNHFWNGLG